jgi:hypothetical protein
MGNIFPDPSNFCVNLYDELRKGKCIAGIDPEGALKTEQHENSANSVFQDIAAWIVRKGRASMKGVS